MADNLFISNFKRRLFYGIKGILFICALIPMIFVVGNKYSVASTENQINNYNESRWNEFYNLPKNSIDMVFLGSSHSYCTFDPENFDTVLGTNSYQLGMPLQHMDSTYFTLLEVLNYQKPKKVVVEVYWDMLDDEFELTQAGYLFQVLRNPELEKQYIKEVFPLSQKLMYNTDIFRYQSDYFAYRNSKLKKTLEAKYGVYTPATEKQEGIEKYRSKGYTYCNYHMLPDEMDKTNQFKNFDGKEWKINETQKKYLQKLIDTCNNNNIEVIMVTAPIAPVSYNYIENYDDIHNVFQKLADENKLVYLDFNIINAQEHILTNDNFRDDAHLNDSGVKIVDKYMIEHHYIN